MLKLSKLSRGDPSLPPLIFLHGFLGNKEDWESMISFFEKSYHCIAIDLPGHGYSPYCDHIVEQIKLELVQLPIKPICICYSMGGRIAIQLQEYIRQLIALSVHPGLETQKERAARFQADEEWAEKLLSLPLDVFLAEWYSQALFQTLRDTPLLLQGLLKQRIKQNPEYLAKVLRQLSLSRQPHVTQFIDPTLFLYGEEDLKFRQLYCKLPKNVTIRSVKSSGHAVHLENPSHCAEQIMQWMDSCKLSTQQLK